MQLIGPTQFVYETIGHPTMQATIHAPPGVRLMLITIFLQHRGHLSGSSSKFWMN